MKKIITVIVLAMACFSVSAESVDWETFQIEVKKKYGNNLTTEEIKAFKTVQDICYNNSINYFKMK